MKFLKDKREELNNSSSHFLQKNYMIENYLNYIQEDNTISNALQYAKHGIKTINASTSLYQKAPLVGIFAMPGATEILGSTFYAYNYMKSILSREAEKCKKKLPGASMIQLTECIDNARKKLLEERVSKLEILKSKCKRTKFSDKCIQKIDQMIHNLEEKIKNIKVLIF